MALVEIINVVIGRNRDGWYVARSEELPGLYLAHEEIAAVLSDVPAAIAALYRADYGQEVKVIAGAYRGAAAAAGMPWITIPAHIAKNALCP
jgi:hypothetical protein